MPYKLGETVSIYIQNSDLQWFLYFARERFMEVGKLLFYHGPVSLVHLNQERALYKFTRGDFGTNILAP